MFSIDSGAFEPARAHFEDAGIDLRSRENKVIKAKSSVVFNTGVHVTLPKNSCGLLVSKSGMNIKHDITSTGLIDEGYTGEIVVKLYNHGENDYEVKVGDKITQLLILPILKPDVKIEITEARGIKGFGSTN